MKFCLLTNFPIQYLEDIYSSRPDLQKADFKTLSAQLALSNPAGAQLWAQPLMDAGHRVDFIVANDQVSQGAWLAERLPDFKPRAAASAASEVVIEQLRKFKPEVLCVFDPLTFDDAFLRQLKVRPRWIVGYTADISPKQGSMDAYDLFLTPCASCAQKAQRHGVRNARVFGVAFSRAAAEAVFQTPESIDVLFCGQWPTKDGKRRQLIECLAEGAARADRPFKLALHLNVPAGEVIPPNIAPFVHRWHEGRERWKAIRRAAISVADVLDEDAVPMGVYKSTGIGTLTFTEARPSLAGVFRANEEVVTYEDLADLMAKIDKFLENRQARIRIAKAGQERSLTAFSIEARVAELIAMVEGEPPSVAPSTRPWWQFWG